jgi:hypothetical protein
MRYFAVRALTWCTVTAAVASAGWLAATEPGWPELRKGTADEASALRLPKEPTAAGRASGTERREGRPAQPGVVRH